MYISTGVAIIALVVLILLVTLLIIAVLSNRANRLALEKASLTIGEQSQQLARQGQIIEECFAAEDQLFSRVDSLRVQLAEALTREQQATEVCRPWLETYGASLAMAGRTLEQAWDKVAEMIPSSLMDLRTIALISYGEHRETMKESTPMVKLLDRRKKPKDRELVGAAA